ncbi:MAG: sugar phosphate isomerase/epimerase [Planctomycetes bacterium]|nr:sugar phosphate isomerase/epimerase [Planctomycetota bacterium]
MNIKQVAVQLYTVRDYIKTPKDIVESLKKIKSIGYDAVQISGMGPISEDELMRILDGEGLICCATHENGMKILKEPEAIVERLRKLRCHYTAYPFPSGVKLETLADVEALAASLNDAGRILHKFGMVLTYHNHNIEFRSFDSRLMLEVLYEKTDPRYLQGEIDVYWVQYGGGNPADWCRRLKGRLPLLHLKDYMTTINNQPTFAEVGYGNLNWKDILSAAEDAGCQWFIVEQDICSVNPFESLKMSFEYIKANLCI